MSFFFNLKIGARLALGFGLVLFLMAAVALLGYSRVQQLHTHLDDIAGNAMVNIRLASEMRDWVKEAADAVRNTALLIDENTLEVEESRTQLAQKKYDAAAKEMATLKNEGEGLSLLNDLSQLRGKIGPLYQQLFAMAKDQRNAEGTALWRSAIKEVENKWVKSLDRMVSVQEKTANLAVEQANSAYKSAWQMLLGLSLLALGLGAALAYLIRRSIVEPLDIASAVADQMARGDLTVTIEQHADDELGQLLNSMRNMLEHLTQRITDVRIASDVIDHGAKEIAAGNTDVSERVERQAGSIEETAASIEELTANVRRNAENASQANQLIGNTVSVAERGGAVVTDVVKTMSEINESSRQIVDIISVIDGIAFQTNILALNAAVEAARAGEQGRGFAVVASEVRNLAQRSANAAKEIKILIGTSVDKIDAGNQLAGRAGVAMGEIVGSVRQVTDLMSEIARSLGEQTHRIEEINSAIGQMDEMTQQNAALVEESAAAAESMQEQSQVLVQSMSHFTLTQSGRSSVPKAGPRRLTY